MQATLSPKILAFVEGDMERQFCNQNFRYVHVVEIRNGSGWKLDAICGQISSKFKALNLNADQIVVWIDKENQNCSRQEYARAIMESLVSAGANPSRVHICLPDKMTENIILADEALIRGFFNKPGYTYAGDGCNGKHILKGLFAEIEGNYKETFHGVQLLKKVRLSRAAGKTASAAEFLATMKLSCWWI
ncbi:MAG: DUF4276 family protein [Phenylobacterium sp.]|nr:DUF4276 family protein [Phenylobacterium sp.]